MTPKIRRAILAMATVLAVPVMAQQVTPHDHEHDVTTSVQQAEKTTAPDHQMMSNPEHQMMMGRPQMMAEMKAADERIQQLVTKMNAETGEQKIGTMAELLTALAVDRTRMQRHMMDGAMCPMAQSAAK